MILVQVDKATMMIVYHKIPVTNTKWVLFLKLRDKNMKILRNCQLLGRFLHNLFSNNTI